MTEKVFHQNALESKLGYKFKDPELLRQAVTHASLERSSWNVYERLEFLGDRVLGLVIAHKLLERFPQEREGDIARRYVQLVRREALANIAKEITFGDYLLVSDGEEASGARESNTILSDALEAAIGALYLDGGVEAASEFIHKYWEPLIEREIKPPLDAKTALQEWAQMKRYELPEYTVVSLAGPAHSPEFTIEVALKNHKPRQGVGRSKRRAEQKAAELLLEDLKLGV